ncbi:hypothetical protein OAT67_01860, partial [Bacteriovoracaceae bacterium]|nr:hypothetical protein [Bacteriovoracaceae bacterium]
PFQNCGSIFDGVDKGTRFGIVFGRSKKSKTYGNLYLQIPILENSMPVDFSTKKIAKKDLMLGEDGTILPYFNNVEEYDLFNSWFSNRVPVDSWGRGRINLGDRKSYEKYKKIIGDKGKYDYRIVKSEKRVKSGLDQFKGILHTPFGKTIKSLDSNLEKHYKQKKLIIPNVKRNGVRKVLVSYEKDCVVEQDYNFTSEIKPEMLNVLRSFTYNAVVNCMTGSYHVNASLLNQLGILPFSLQKYSDFELEVELLKKLGVGEADALAIIFRAILVEYPDNIKQLAIDEISAKYSDAFRHLELGADSNYSHLISQQDLFTSDKPKVFDVDATTQLSGYIVSTLKNDNNFGRVKFAKVLYLTQHLCDIDLGMDWKRKAAGPYNDKDLKAVERSLEKDFGIQSITKQVQGRKYVKYKSESRLKTSEFISDFEKPKQKDIKEWVKWFKPFTTEKMELIATIFAAWNDMLIKGESVTMKKIINEVRNNWSPTKLKFSESRIRQEVNFMKQNDLVPTGFGYSTEAS